MTENENNDGRTPPDEIKPKEEETYSEARTRVDKVAELLLQIYPLMDYGMEIEIRVPKTQKIILPNAPHVTIDRIVVFKPSICLSCAITPMADTN